MKSKYVTKQALILHICLIAWLAMCASAAYWQVGRAIQGNSLSFLYSIEWPCFAVLGVFGWWALLNQEKVTEHQEKARREFEDNQRALAQAARAAESMSEDPQMSAYNDHLESISTKPKKKLFGH